MTGPGDRPGAAPLTGDHVGVDTPAGPGRLVLPSDPPREPSAVLLLGHGASGSLTALDLTALAGHGGAAGLLVLRFEQPWRTAGRRMSAPAPTLDDCWQAAVAQVRGRWPVPLLVGGRSQGARVACRTADAVDALGVVCLSFPLHPPGRPEKSRLDELLAPTAPVLVCQGDRDAFGGFEEVAGQVGERTVRLDPTALEPTADPVAPVPWKPTPGVIAVRRVPGADHSLRTRKADPLTPTGVASLIVAQVTAFATALTTG